MKINLNWMIWFTVNIGMIFSIHYAITAGITWLMITLGVATWILIIATLPLLSENMILALMLKGGGYPPADKWLMIFGDLIITYLFILGATIYPTYAIGFYITAFGFLMSMFIQQRMYKIAEKLREKINNIVDKLDINIK